MQTDKSQEMTRDWTQDFLISSQTFLPSELPDSVMTEECWIVLIPKLATNLAVSNSLKDVTKLMVALMPD